MLFVALALLIALPLAEIYVIVQVGQAIGAWPTIAALLATSILGWWLVRSQGRAAWRRFSDAISAGRVPAREAADGALIVAGGALLLTPGFITDALGALLLAPFTRAAARRTLGLFVGGWKLRTAGAATHVWNASRPGARRPYDVEGHATDREPPRTTDHPAALDR